MGSRQEGNGKNKWEGKVISLAGFSGDSNTNFPSAPKPTCSAWEQISIY